LNNLSLLTVHWNTATLTLQFLDRVIPIVVKQGWQFYCLENHSSVEQKNLFLSGLRERGMLNHSNFHFRESNKNLGFAGGINFLFSESISKYPSHAMWILNTDIAIPDSTIEFIQTNIDLVNEPRLIGAYAFDEDGKDRLFSGASFPDTFFGFQHSKNSKLEISKFYPTAYCEGSSFVISNFLCRKILENRGELFDSRLFLYAEDLELGLKMKQLGYQCVLNSNFLIYHKHSQSGGGSGNPLAFYYITRNRINLANWYFNRPTYYFYLLYSFSTRIILNLLFYRKRNQKTRTAIFRGLVDGANGIIGKWHNH
jgi:GT2 family glycosyltransferase